MIKFYFRFEKLRMRDLSVFIGSLEEIHEVSFCVDFTLTMFIVIRTEGLTF